MNPLIPLALQVAPGLARRVFSDRAGDLVQTVSGVVSDVVGTSDPEAAAEAIKDPQTAMQLQIRLAEIEAEADRREFEAIVADRENARATMVGLQGKRSALAWGPVVVSVVVVVGFFAALLSLIFLVREGGSDPASQQVTSIVNIAVGALTSGFATVVSFWLGSSNGSQKKDLALRGVL